MSLKKNDIHFEMSERKILLRIIDLIVVLLSLYFVVNFFDFNYFRDTSGLFFQIVLLCCYLTFFGTVFDMYQLPVASDKLQVTKSIFLTTSATSLAYLLTPVLTPVLPGNRSQIIYFYLAILVPLLMWRWFYLLFLTAPRFTKKSIIICRGKKLNKLISSLEEGNPYYKIVGFFDTDSDNEFVQADNKEIIKLNDTLEIEQFVRKNRINEIIIGPNTDIKTIHAALLKLMEEGVCVKDYSHIYESSFYKIPVDLIEKDFYRHFLFSRSNNNKLYLFLVRFGEIIFSIVGLIVLLIMLPFILLGNLIANKGPLFYIQERVGRNGKIFNIIKLRTMIKNAEKDGAVFAQKGDMRITPFGRFLRKSRIDEVPQLLNVLKGEMSVIGPRPERAFFVNQISEKMSLYSARHAVKPGLTGWAQINYKYGDSIEDSVEKLKYDLFYIKHRGLILDANIVVKTIGTVLFYRGQ